MKEQNKINNIIFDQITAGLIAWESLLTALVSSGNVDLVKLRDELVTAQRYYLDNERSRMAKYINSYLDRVQTLSADDPQSPS